MTRAGPMFFRRLRSPDAEVLGSFFEENNTAETTRSFNPFPMTVESARELLAPGSRDLFFGAYQSGKLVAFSMLRGWDEGYAVPSFGIVTGQVVRNQGIGRRLTAWTIRWADAIGCSKVRLSVFENNPGAIYVYQQSGFEITERQIDQSGHQRIIMHRACRRQNTKVYVSTSCLSAEETFIKRLQDWRDAGFFSIECSNYPGLAPDFAVEAVAQVGGDLLFHNYFPPPEEAFVLNVASPDPSNAQHSMAFIRDAVKLSSSAGAAWYSFHAGFCAEPSGRDAYGFRFPSVSAKDHAAGLKRQDEVLKRLSDELSKSGMGLLVENNVCIQANRDVVLLADPEEIKCFFQRNGFLPNLGMLFDTGHWMVSAKTLGFDPREAEVLMPYIKGFHLHDNDGMNDQHRPMDMRSDWVRFAREVQPAYVSLEGHYSGLGNLQQAVLEMEVTFS